jgi:hypothetical protein
MRSPSIRKGKNGLNQSLGRSQRRSNQGRLIRKTGKYVKMLTGLTGKYGVQSGGVK